MYQHFTRPAGGPEAATGRWGRKDSRRLYKKREIPEEISQNERE